MALESPKVAGYIPVDFIDPNKYKEYVGDEFIESEMLRSCLIIDNDEVIKKRSDLIKKSIFSWILKKQECTIDEIKDQKSLESQQVMSVLKELKNKGHVEIIGEKVKLTSKAEEESKKIRKEVTEVREGFINEVLSRIKTPMSSAEKDKVRYNIKLCLSYYFEGMALAFLDPDSLRNFKVTPKLTELASFRLSGRRGRELANEMIEEIGRLIEHPSPEQKKTLETIARAFIAARLIKKDPQLRNFKKSIINNKVFILDTDVVLNAIVNNGRCTRQYRLLIQHLIDLRCEIYVPSEVVMEVYHHAEASITRYAYCTNTLRLQGDGIRESLKNLFIEDYYTDLHSSHPEFPDWKTYIGNFFERSEGPSFTLSVIASILGRNVHYNEMPGNVAIDSQEQELLRDKSYEATLESPRAAFRSEERNREIANVDSLLYLTIKQINKSHNELQPVGTSSILKDKYHLLTEFSRIHQCAVKLGLGAHVLCNPKALAFYLMNVGILQNDDVQLTDLFDNPFLDHVARELKDDIDKIAQTGIETKGKSLTRLRLDMSKDLQIRLSSDNPDEREQARRELNSKGYTFNDEKDKLKEANAQLQEQLDQKEKEISQLKNKVRIAKEQKWQDLQKRKIGKLKSSRKRRKK